ncbi:MAG: hypothetical protein JWQ66_123 [Mucilaginibacter sp.]|nr:hypothetical protein [Mucilaginibacter sp.]
MRTIHKAKKGEYPEYAEMYMKLLPNAAPHQFDKRVLLTPVIFSSS